VSGSKAGPLCVVFEELSSGTDSVVLCSSASLLRPGFFWDAQGLAVSLLQWLTWAATSCRPKQRNQVRGAADCKIRTVEPQTADAEAYDETFGSQSVRTLKKN